MVIEFSEKGKSIYKKNLEALSRISPIMASIMSSAEITADYAYSVAQNGYPNISKKIDDEWIEFQSSRDPVKEADRYAQSYYQRNIHALDNCMALLMFGLGSGYYLESFLKIVNWLKTMIIVEPDPVIAKIAFHQKDFTTYINNQEISFIIGEISKTKLTLASAARSLHFAKVTIVMHPRCSSFYVQTKDDVSKVFIDFVLEKRMAINTYASQTGNALFENYFRNIKHMLKTPSVDILSGKLEGKVALCVGAGPSLGENIDAIQKNRDNLCILAVDSAVPALVDKGIIPDVVSAVDPLFHKYERIMKYCEKMKKTALVYAYGTYTELLDNWLGPKFFYRINANNSIDDAIWGNTKHLLTPYTVSIANIVVASVMKVKEIILVGQDLCFAKDQTHSTGSAYTHKIVREKYMENGKLYVDYLSGFDHKTVLKREIVVVKDYGGNDRYTYPNFAQFITHIENAISYINVPVKNLTLEGAKIKNAEQIDEKYLLEVSSDTKYIEYKNIHANKSINSNINELKKEIEKIYAALKELYVMDNFIEKDLYLDEFINKLQIEYIQLFRLLNPIIAKSLLRYNENLYRRKMSLSDSKRKGLKVFNSLRYIVSLKKGLEHLSKKLDYIEELI